MADFEDGSYSCTPGLDLIAKVLAGRCEMRYTRAAIGSGYIPEGESPKTMTEPAGYEMDIDISGITNPEDEECQVTLQLRGSNVTNAFYATGIMLYAEDPDEGEVPYGYLLMENEPEYIRSADSMIGKITTFDMVVHVGAVDVVRADIADGSFVSYQEMIETLAGMIVRREITIPASGWNEDDSIYSKYYDIYYSDVTEDIVPEVSIHQEALSTAADCEFCPTAETYAGYVRLRAKAVPAAEMDATLTLLCSSLDGVLNEPSSGSGGGGYVLPVATKSTLGGVKIGDYLSIANDGTLSVNTSEVAEEISARDGEMEEMLKEELGGAS